MSARLISTNAVTQQKSPVIVVVQDINEENRKSIYIKNDPTEHMQDNSDEDSSSSPLHHAQVYYESKENDVIDSQLIWSHKKPTESDSHATEYFLQIRGSDKYKSLFADKKFGKYKLWSEIAEEMNNAGYYVGEGREAAERCRQKFSNLEKSFLNYLKQIKNGSRKKDPPQFYDLMYNIVDHEDKLYKQEQNALIDAVRENLQVELITSKDNVITSGPSRSTEGIQTEFNPSINIPNDSKFKKLKQKNEIINLLTQQHAEMIKLQREYLEKLDKHLTIQNEQREKMIQSFMEAMKESPCKCNRKKRRRTSSSDSETLTTNIDLTNT